MSPGFGSAAAFSLTAADYAATMAPALAPVAAEVVRRADLRAGQTVLDMGTGTGTAARLALGDGRRVIGLDAAAGMLQVAALEAPGVELIEADFAAVPLEDATVDVVLAVHALLFASDRITTLREWLRVTSPGGRVSLSVPGPPDRTPSATFAAVYERHGVGTKPTDYPGTAELTGWARAAGWDDVATAVDPSAVIPLADEHLFRSWLRVGRTSSDWSADQFEAFAVELMAAAPRAADGSFRLPFGAQYLTARRPALDGPSRARSSPHSSSGLKPGAY